MVDQTQHEHFNVNRQNVYPTTEHQPKQISTTAPTTKVEECPTTSEVTPETGRSPVHAILVMGATGTGKSKFTAAATRKPVLLGHGLGKCTTELQAFHNESLNLSLIDSPGFNDPGTSDIDVLEALVSFLADGSHHVIGVVYLHAITDKKITGTARLSLRLLREICGEHFYQNVVLATSMWDNVPQEAMQSTITRESQLRASKDFWGDMMPKGSRYIRWSESPADGCNTATEIVKLCRTRTDAPMLKILIELAQGRHLEETSVGKLATEEIRKRQEQAERALQEEVLAAQEEKRQLEEEVRAKVARQQGAMQCYDGRINEFVEDVHYGNPGASRVQSWHGEYPGKQANSGGKINKHPSVFNGPDRPTSGKGGSRGQKVYITGELSNIRRRFW